MINNSKPFNVKSGHFVIGALMIVFSAAIPAKASLMSYAHAFDRSGGYRDYGTLNGDRSTSSVVTDFSRAAASAQYGILKASSSASVGENNGLSSYVSATFTEQLTLNKAGISGQRGLVTFAYATDYDAWVSATEGGSSNGSVSFMAQTGYNYDWYLDYRNASDGSYTMYEERNPDGTQGRIYGVPRLAILYHTAEVTWRHAFETKFELSISTGASAPPNGSAAYMFDASHSAYWAGIVSATADGVEVEDYEIASRSGTDYSRSFVPTAEIPEPGGLAIIGLGLVGLGIQRLQKRGNKLLSKRA